MTSVDKITKDYKDFFEVTDFLATDTVDFTYRKTKVREEGLFKQENEDCLVSFERLDAKRSLSIYNYLIYKLPTIKDDETKKWYVKSIRFFENILSKKINNSQSFVTPHDIFIFHRYEKIEYSRDKRVGRLYCSHSIQTLPREIRYFLFKDDYLDFDIVNAHPSILYLYSIDNDLVLNGTLKRYVVERSLVMSQIQQELGVNLSTVKRDVLKLLNKTWEDDFTKKSKTLSKLDNDFQTIRDHLWASYCNGDLQNYEAPVLKSMKRKEKQYILDGIVDEKKLLLLKKVSLQSFYCQTQESAHLIKLVKFLRKEYEKILKADSMQKFTDYYSSTDKKVELKAKHTLFIVPFFDGLYISSPNKFFMKNLGDIVEKYNKQSTVVKFLQKKIEPRVERIPDTDELRKFTIIYEWLGKSSAKHYLSMFIKKTGLNEQVVALLKDQFEEKKHEDCWEADYKLLIEKIKSKIFNTLLKIPIKTSIDIENYIKELKTK